MNSSQVVGTSDRILIAIATWFLGYAVQKGWLTTADSAAFLPIIIAVPAAIWGWWNNRGAALVASASSLPEVQSMTISDPAMASAAKEADPNTQVKLT